MTKGQDQMSATTSVTTKARWIIERQLATDLTLDSIADACGVSRFHLAHAFANALGMPVMDYVRARRLSQAALRLADGAEDILGLALGSGYGSHEAFSRAFKRRFGVTPEEVRKRASTDGLNLIGAVAMRVPKRADLAPPRLVDGPEVLAAGLSVRYDFFDASGIPAQWQTFMRELVHRVPQRVPGIPFSISADLRDDLTFAYITAVEVSRIDEVPPPLVSIRVPARRWAVFHHGGHVSAIPATYAAIWDYGFHDQGLTVEAAPSMERHCPTFDPSTGEGGVEIWMPIAADRPT
jgi:AraC family transcriptional regulator